MTERDKLLAAIAEAKLRVSDLTRELNESPAAEQDPSFTAKLERLHDCVIELEQALEALSPS